MTFWTGHALVPGVRNLQAGTGSGTSRYSSTLVVRSYGDRVGMEFRDIYSLWYFHQSPNLIRRLDNDNDPVPKNNKETNKRTYKQMNKITNIPTNEYTNKQTNSSTTVATSPQAQPVSQWPPPPLEEPGHRLPGQHGQYWITIGITYLCAWFYKVFFLRGEEGAWIAMVGLDFISLDWCHLISLVLFVGFCIWTYYILLL